MPKETFSRLKPDKQQMIINAFYREFAIKSFDEASITSVVKSIGIAKGSIYQYFENKLDLFLFLAQEANKVKLKYVVSVKRADHPNYWSYMRMLYVEGIEFDRLHHLESHFLHSIDKNFNAPSIKALYDSWLQQIITAFKTMVQHEVDIGLFRKDLPPDKLAFILYKALTSINDYMTFFHGVDVQKSISKGEPIYSDGKDKKLLETVDEHFLLFRNTFDNPKL